MKTARLYQCAHCHCQVVICSDCDRGNIYCNGDCARTARLTMHRQSNQIYQKTLAGKIKHAKRQERYRHRQKGKVTDGGSPVLPVNDVLVAPQEEIQQPKPFVVSCHFCGKEVPKHLRTEFLVHAPMWILGTSVILKKQENP